VGSDFMRVAWLSMRMRPKVPPGVVRPTVRKERSRAYNHVLSCTSGSQNASACIFDTNAP
jgi:hypothetical protein